MEGEITMESMKYSNTIFLAPLDPWNVVSEVYANAVNLPRRTPLVIAGAGGYPKEINLYQTSKTPINALAPP